MPLHVPFLPSVSVPLSSSVPIPVSIPVPVPVSVPVSVFVAISAPLTTPPAFSVPRVAASSTLAVTLSTARPVEQTPPPNQHIAFFSTNISKECYCVCILSLTMQALALYIALRACFAMHTRNRESYRYIPFPPSLGRMVSVAAVILLFFISLVVC